MKLAIKVTSNAKQDHVKEGGVNAYGNRVLKIKTVATPQDGKANEAVIKILAQYFKIKQSAIKILSGETARLKLVEIEDSVEDQVSLVLRHQ